MLCAELGPRGTRLLKRAVLTEQLNKTLLLSKKTKEANLVISLTLNLMCFYGVNEKLLSWSKKELEFFIQAKFEDYNLGRTSQKACPLEVKTQFI